MPKTSKEGGLSLPPNWIEKESSSKAPGKSFYYHTLTKRSVWSLETVFELDKILRTEMREERRGVKGNVDNCSVRGKRSIGAMMSEADRIRSLPKISKKKKSAARLPSRDTLILSLDKEDFNLAKSNGEDNFLRTDGKREKLVKSGIFGLGVHSVKNRKKPYKCRPSTSADLESSHQSSSSSSFNNGSGPDIKDIIPKTFIKSLTPEPSVAPSEHLESKSSLKNEEMAIFYQEESLDTVEEMEVDEIDPGILEELRTLRNDRILDDSALPRYARTNELQCKNEGYFTIIVDTNVFISDLQTVEKLLKEGHKIHVPWAVLRELDALKDSNRYKCIPKDESASSRLSFKARKAIDFLHGALSEGRRGIHGQTGEEESEASLLFKGDNSDDKILQATLYLRKRYEGNEILKSHIVLFSNDKNLLNKALLHGVRGSSSVSIFKELTDKKVPTEVEPLSLSNKMSKTPFDHKKELIDEIKDCVDILLKNVIKIELVRYLGDPGWLSALNTTVPPIQWSLHEVFTFLFSRWEFLLASILKKESRKTRKSLKDVQGALSRPRPQNKIWPLISHGLRSFESLAYSLRAKYPADYDDLSRKILFRLELVKKRSNAFSEGKFQEYDGNINESFNTIYKYISTCAAHYASCLSVDIQPGDIALTMPKYEIRSIDLKRKRHLFFIAEGSKKLAIKLNELLQVPLEELSSSTPQLLDLMESSQFLESSSELRPEELPPPDPLSKFVPRDVVEFARSPSGRFKMESEMLHQIRKSILTMDTCIDKINNAIFLF